MGDSDSSDWSEGYDSISTNSENDRKATDVGTFNDSGDDDSYKSEVRTERGDAQSWKESSLPTCTIRLAGKRYKKDIELSLDEKMDDIIYNILKCMDRNCISLDGMLMSGLPKKCSMGAFFQNCFANFSSCFALKKFRVHSPNLVRRRSCHPCMNTRWQHHSYYRKQKPLCKETFQNGHRTKYRSSRYKNKCWKDSSCKRMFRSCGSAPRCSRTCQPRNNDDCVLIEICPSQAAIKDANLKCKQKERGVGTDACPELEMLLRGDNFRCVAKKTGMKCGCRRCGPDRRRKCDFNNHAQYKQPEKEQQSAQEEYVDDGSFRESDEMVEADTKTSHALRRKNSSYASFKSVAEENRLSFKKTYSLLMNSKYKPLWNSNVASSTQVSKKYCDDFTVKFVQLTPALSANDYSAQPEQLNVYSAFHKSRLLIRDHAVCEQNNLSGKLKSQNPVSSNEEQRTFSNEFDDLQKLRETSKSIEGASEDCLKMLKTIQIRDSLRLHTLFQRSLASSFSASSAEASDAIFDGNSKHQQERPVKELVLSQHSAEQCPVAAFISNCCLGETKATNLKADDSLSPKIAPSQSTVHFKHLHDHESVNFMGLLKMPLKDETSLCDTSKTKRGRGEEPSIKRNRFERIKMYLKTARKKKLKKCLPISLDKKRGELNLNALLSNNCCS